MSIKTDRHIANKLLLKSLHIGVACYHSGLVSRNSVTIAVLTQLYSIAYNLSKQPRGLLRLVCKVLSRSCTVVHAPMNIAISKPLLSLQMKIP